MSGRHRKHVRKILADARRMVAAHGGTVALVPGGKHEKLVIEVNGRRYVKPISNGAGDVVQRKCHEDIRRELMVMAS